VNRALFAFLATFAVASAFARSAAAPEVTFVSPCECQGFHGKNRWIAKTDLSFVPSDKSAIQSVTPSQGDEIAKTSILSPLRLPPSF